MQLEELLHQADARANGGAGEADRLQAELRRAEMEHARVMAAVEAKLKAKVHLWSRLIGSALMT